MLMYVNVINRDKWELKKHKIKLLKISKSRWSNQKMRLQGINITMKDGIIIKGQ